VWENILDFKKKNRASEQDVRPETWINDIAALWLKLRNEAAF
jgi:hypothetical protein